MDMSRFSLDSLLNGTGNGVLHSEKVAEQPAGGKPAGDGRPHGATSAKPQAGGGEGGGGEARAAGAASSRKLEDSPAGLGLKTGNPYHRRVARLKWALLDAAPEEEIVAIGKKLVQLALEGHVGAARVLFAYVLPKGVEPDRVNGYRKEQRMEEEMRPIMKSMEPEFALDIVRMMRPVASAGKAALMGEVLRSGSMDILSSPEKLRTVLSGGVAAPGKGKKARRKAGKP